MASLRLSAAALSVLAMLAISGGAAAQTSNSPVVKQQLTGLTWNGKDFLASYGESSAYLLDVSLDAKTVTRFAPSFVGWNETYIAVADGSGGFPQGYVYVSSNQSIYEVTPSGNNFKVFSTPPGVSRIGFLAFDRVGTWGHSLFAVDDSGLLWQISANGTAKIIQNFGKGVKPEGIVVAPLNYGNFGGSLFVSLEYAKKIVAISPSDTSKVITVAQIAGEAPERIMSIPPDSDLYVARWMPGNILRVAAEALSRFTGSLLVITEGDVEANGSIVALTAVGGNVAQSKIFVESDHPHFEAADFVSSTVSQQAWSSTSNSSPMGSPSLGGTSFTLGVVVLVVALVVAAMVIYTRGRART